MSSKEDVKLKGLQQENWDNIIHNRVAGHVKIFTDFLMFSNFLLVSHRNLVSAFDIKKKSWEFEFEFDDVVRCLTLDKAVDSKGIDTLKKKSSMLFRNLSTPTISDLSPQMNKKFSVATHNNPEDEFHRGLASAMAKSRITLLVGTS